MCIGTGAFEAWNAGTKIRTILLQIAICHPTDPGVWGDKLLKKALGKHSFGPLFFMDRQGVRRCEAYTRRHAEPPKRHYIVLGEVANIDDEFLDDDGKRHRLSDFIGVVDGTRSSWNPGNVVVFSKARKRTA